MQNQNQNQNSLLVKRQTDNTTPVARIAINHGLFQCSNIRWITRKVFEHAACGLVFKHRTLTFNVYKQTKGSKACKVP